MGFSSGSTIIRDALDYADQHELWNDRNVVKIVEKFAIALLNRDWDTANECYYSRTFRAACKFSTDIGLREHFREMQKRGLEK